MLIEACVLLAQKICGASIRVLLPAPKATVPATGRAEGVVPALLTKINPEIDRLANRITAVFRVIIRFMVCSFLNSLPLFPTDLRCSPLTFRLWLLPGQDPQLSLLAFTLDLN
jgi:hypothetical protein